VRPEELITLLKNYLDQHNHELGFRYIAFGDGQLLPSYPAALVVYDSTNREIHGTHYFLTSLAVQIVIMHADLTLNRMERAQADMQLATAVVQLIHDRGLTLQDSRIHRAFVVNEEPAVISTENLTAIGTALTVIAEVREAFK
jgi:hypothetical protein